MKTGIELIAEERREQIEKHGRTIAEDVKHNTGYELSWAASFIATAPDQDLDICTDLIVQAKLYKWDRKILERIVAKPYKERLIIAGALIAAEIDRLNEIE